MLALRCTEPEELDPLHCVRSIRDGSPESETTFALFFQPRIRVYAYHALQSRAAVDDVVQETLWAAIRALREGRLEKPENLAAFVYSIARHRVMDVHRSEARQRTEPIPDNFDFPALPDADAADREREQIAREAIRGLEPLDREVLNLILLRGLKHEEIGRQLSLTTDAVRQRKCRALRRITEKIREVFASPAQQGVTNQPRPATIK